MKIERINTYNDPRFSQTVLNQHGAFLVDGIPCEIEIISDYEAQVRGEWTESFPNLIEEFRFYTPHITKFFSDSGEILMEFPRVNLISLEIQDIQPTQFFVDKDKLAAVGTFLQGGQDIIIQAAPYGNRYISLDGHTRLYYAVMKGWTQVRAAVDEAEDWALAFAHEAEKRSIFSPADMTMLSHKEYVKRWDQFCSDFFASREG